MIQPWYIYVQGTFDNFAWLHGYLFCLITRLACCTCHLSTSFLSTFDRELAMIYLMQLFALRELLVRHETVIITPSLLYLIKFCNLFSFICHRHRLFFISIFANTSAITFIYDTHLLAWIISTVPFHSVRAPEPFSYRDTRLYISLYGYLLLLFL